MSKLIFNEDGIKLGITDVVSYLSIQIEEENITKVLNANYYWDLHNRCVDVLIDEGFCQGTKYEDSGTVEETIEVIEEFYKTHFYKDSKHVSDIKNSILLAVASEIDGFEELKPKLKGIWNQ